MEQTVKPQEPQKEAGVKANTAEAMRLYQRGVAAARGGQKRIAAGLLTRSVQYDPNNEGAWLWLSGVIDDPHQIAFCLNSVLKLNPGNERARRGLRWLEERQLLTGNPKPAPLFEVEVGKAQPKPRNSQAHDSWWVNWRQWSRDRRLANLMVWSVPLVVLFLALIINQAFEMSANQPRPRPDIPTVSAPTVPTAVVAASLDPSPGTTQNRPTAVPVLSGHPVPVRESQTIAYLNQIIPIRQQLRNAVEQYRSTTGKPGSAAVGHTTAARSLQTSVEQAYETMQQMSPPPALQEAHADYLRGLALELEAIDALSEFYGSYKTELANLAAVRFQDANAHFARARATYEAQLQRLEMTGTISAYTPR